MPFAGSAWPLAFLAVMAVAGCGASDESDQSVIDQARRDGAQTARQNARIKALEEKLHEAEKRDQSAASSPTPLPTAVPASSPASSYIASYVPYTSSASGFSYIAEVPERGRVVRAPGVGRGRWCAAENHDAWA
jgi:hypothetical protein